MIRATLGSQLVAAKEKGGGRGKKGREKWRTAVKNEDLVAATRDTVGQAGLHTAATHFFGIDYRGVLVYVQGDMTQPSPLQFLPAKGFSHKAAC